MVVDGHCHVWPDAIAERALAPLSRDLPRVGDGKVASLIETMDRAGVDRAVCLGVPSTPDRVEAANRFAASLDAARLVGFGAIHPDLSIEDNLASLRRHGLKGIKVHPIFQGFGLDDPRLLEILDALRGEFIVVMHVGRGGAGASRCSPELLRELVLRLPGLDLVACHFGGYRVLEQAEELIVGLPVYLDTAWPPGLATLDPSRVRRLIERHGPERVVLASDWPVTDPAPEIAAVEALGLPPQETEAILGGNFARLLGQS